MAWCTEYQTGIPRRRTMAGLNPKWLIGRTIVAVDLGAHYPTQTTGSIHDDKPLGERQVRDYGKMHQPEITLDNGARLRFHTEEHPEGHEYGTKVLYIPAKRR